MTSTAHRPTKRPFDYQYWACWAVVFILAAWAILGLAGVL